MALNCFSIVPPKLVLRLESSANTAKFCFVRDLSWRGGSGRPLCVFYTFNLSTYLIIMYSFIRMKTKAHYSVGVEIQYSKPDAMSVFCLNGLLTCRQRTSIVWGCSRVTISVFTNSRLLRGHFFVVHIFTPLHYSSLFLGLEPDLWKLKWASFFSPKNPLLKLAEQFMPPRRWHLCCFFLGDNSSLIKRSSNPKSS